MKSFSSDAKAAIVAGTAMVGGAGEILCGDPIRLWSGEGSIAIDGHSFTGVGARGIAQLTGASVGSAALGFTLSLSGIEPEALALLEEDDVKDAQVTLWRLIFDGTGTQFLDAHVFSRGRGDVVSTDETVGGEAAITLQVEGVARGLGKRGGRMRSDADQRLIDSSDNGCSRVSFAGQKKLYWGGKTPSRAADVLPGYGPRTPNPMRTRGEFY